MKKKKAAPVLLVLNILLFAPSIGCGPGAVELASMQSPSYEASAGLAGGSMDIPPIAVPLSRLPEIPSIPITIITGDNIIMNGIAEIDASHTKDGYIIVKHLKATHKTLKVIVESPDGTPYIYTLRIDREYEMFPLSEGSGGYRITVYEHVMDNKYSPVLETTQNVRLTDEFAPFIRPNQYVDYSRDSKVAQKAAELTRDSKNTPDKIAAIYNYVIENIAYDHQLAANVQKGYIPNVDKVLKNGKGICFDYASLMTAMLRSQGIPAKLVVGYKGNAYHAWISVYSGEAGRIDGTVRFDEQGWRYMDPTLASGGVRDVSKDIVDKSRYLVKYVY